MRGREPELGGSPAAFSAEPGVEPREGEGEVRSGERAGLQRFCRRGQTESAPRGPGVARAPPQRHCTAGRGADDALFGLRRAAFLKG